jgi:feruloyl-CoA synthase
MPVVNVPGMRPVNMGELAVEHEISADGVFQIRSRLPLGEYPRSLIDRSITGPPSRPTVCFSPTAGQDGEWRKVTYAEAAHHARAIGQFLLDKGLSAERPLVILSGNSLEHALLALGGMTAGVPFSRSRPPIRWSRRIMPN